MLYQERFDQTFQRLETYPLRNAALDDRFREMILTAHDDDLTRINAYHLAKAWNEPVHNILTWLLYACHVGLFELHWESHCPVCTGISEIASTIGMMHQDLTCRTCHTHFHLHFDETTFVTFTVSPAVRLTDPSVMAFAPPGAIKIGEYDATEPFEVVFDAPFAHFLAGANGSEPLALIPVSADAPPVETVTIDYDPGIIQHMPPVPQGKTLIELRNIDRVVVGYVDVELQRQEVRVKGLELALLPAFQQLFAHKTLSQRESLSIRNLTMLFTDITGSTALYQRLGDVAAYNLVRDHFDVLFQEIEYFDGGIVKTIGDAVMAAFLTPESAVQAALAVQKAIHDFNSGRSQEEGLILVKIGIHAGSAIAVHLNDRLDYFGNMVNMAARIQGQSRSAEILLSVDVYHDPSVRHILETTPGIRVSDSIFELAGIEKTQRLFSIASVNG